MKEWPPQRLDWEMYRIEHLSFASNMETSFEGWLQQPWHILYSALRCMSCQERQRQHVCPICCNTVRNSGGTRDAWACFDGCLTHLSTAHKCIGHFLTEDPLSGRGKSMIPSVASLLAELYPNRGAREWLPMLTIIYMAPGGHRQWPISISALLDRYLGWYCELELWLCLTSKPPCRRILSGGLDTVVDQRLQWPHQLHSSSLTLGLRWDAIRLGVTFPRGMTQPIPFTLELLVKESRLPTPFTL